MLLLAIASTLMASVPKHIASSGIGSIHPLTSDPNLIPIHDIRADEPSNGRITGIFVVSGTWDGKNWPGGQSPRLPGEEKPVFFIAAGTDPKSGPLIPWTKLGDPTLTPDSEHLNWVHFDVPFPTGKAANVGLLAICLSGASKFKSEANVDYQGVDELSFAIARYKTITGGLGTESDNVIPIEINRPFVPDFRPRRQKNYKLHFFAHQEWRPSPIIYEKSLAAGDQIPAFEKPEWLLNWGDPITYFPHSGGRHAELTMDKPTYNWVLIYATSKSSEPGLGSAFECDGVVRNVD